MHHTKDMHPPEKPLPPVLPLQIELKVGHHKVKSWAVDMVEVVNLSTGSSSTCPLGGLVISEEGTWVPAFKELQTTDYKVGWGLRAWCFGIRIGMSHLGLSSSSWVPAFKELQTTDYKVGGGPGQADTKTCHTWLKAHPSAGERDVLDSEVLVPMPFISAFFQSPFPTYLDPLTLTPSPSHTGRAPLTPHCPLALHHSPSHTALFPHLTDLSPPTFPH